MAQTILLVEDDKDLHEYVQDLLQKNDFISHSAYEGAKAIRIISKTPPDLVILDLGLPDIDGATLCQDIKKQYPSLPVIILTARDTPADIVKGLNLGADDYVTKPFSGEELIARVKARLRLPNQTEAALKLADLELNQQTLEVTRSGKLIKLTHTEYELLHYLLSNAGRVLTREMILNRVWAYAPDIESRVVDVYIGYLRKKIDNGHHKPLLHSRRGFGYMIKE